MNLTDKTNLLVPYAMWGNAFVQKISQIVNVCDATKNLLIGIYLIEHGRFLYCNEKFKEIMADKFDSFMKDGWEFWYTLIDMNERGSVKKQITDFCSHPYLQNQLTVKYHLQDFCGKNICMKHELILHQLEQHFLAFNYFFDVSDKEKIEHCFDSSTAATQSSFSKRTIYSISPREKQVLKLIADGFSSKEIADMLFISNHTAVSHRKNLIEKFQVKNTAHLVMRAADLLNG